MKHFGKAGLMVALACLMVGNAWADRYWHPRSSVQFGVYLGGPWVYPPYYPYPVYMPRPVVVTPAPPPVYIEREPQAQTLEPGYWYYCNEAQAYYPYVKECPGPWQKVAPQPPQ